MQRVCTSVSAVFRFIFQFNNSSFPHSVFQVTFMLLDQNNREHVIDAFRPDLTSASFQRPVNDMNIASGCPMFLPLFKLQSPKYAYVKEDTLFLKCIVETNY